jgi:hypothetical protein
LLRVLERRDEVGERGVVDAAAALGRGDGEAHGQVRLPDARRPKEHHILAPLDEAQGMEALELVAFDARLEAEVEVGQGLHSREAGGPHGGLQPPLIAERDVAPQQLGHGFAGGELAAVGPAQDVVEGFEGAGHLEIGELGAQPIAERGRGHQPISGRSWA